MRHAYRSIKSAWKERSIIARLPAWSAGAAFVASECRPPQFHFLVVTEEEQACKDGEPAEAAPEAEGQACKEDLADEAAPEAEELACDGEAAASAHLALRRRTSSASRRLYPSDGAAGHPQRAPV